MQPQPVVEDASAEEEEPGGAASATARTRTPHALPRGHTSLDSVSLARRADMRDEDEPKDESVGEPSGGAAGFRSLNTVDGTHRLSVPRTEHVR